MAIRFYTAGEGLTITSGMLNYNADYTIGMWSRMVTDTNAFTTPIGFFGDANNYDGLETAADGTALAVIGNRNNTHVQATVGTLAVSTNVYLALTRSGSTLTGYIITEAGSVSTANITKATGGAAIASNRIGQWVDATELYNGRVGPMKAWTAALTQAELLSEMRTVRPLRLANVWAYWPCLPVATEALRDYSGNGHPWTAAGTISYEDSPPIAWGIAPFLVQAVAGAAAPAAIPRPAWMIAPSFPAYLEL